VPVAIALHLVNQHGPDVEAPVRAHHVERDLSLLHLSNEGRE
jgi:hypothetical protein